MAIDSAEKRRSVVGVGFWLYGPNGVTPNVAKDAEWRQQVGNGYSGIAASAAAEIIAATRKYFVQIAYNMARVKRRRR